MPILSDSTYQPPFLFRNTHINTIYTATSRRFLPLPTQRVTMPTDDGDWLYLDWAQQPTATALVVCLHGLEGHAQRPYMQGMMRRFFIEGWDSVGLNYRGCTGEDNQHLYSYHSGWTVDLTTFIQGVLSQNPLFFPQNGLKNYDKIVLVGFSAGGNIALKYAGEKAAQIAPQIAAVVAFSTPVDLAACSEAMRQPRNWPYMQHFLRTLKQKAAAKHRRFEGQFDLQKVLKATSFHDFDHHFTAPINGYRDAFDYWASASALPLLPHIQVPTLLVNALDDTFLSGSCYPTDFAANKAQFFLEMPRYGGHLGFMAPDNQGFLWTEHRAWAFVAAHVLPPQ